VHKVDCIMAAAAAAVRSSATVVTGAAATHEAAAPAGKLNVFADDGTCVLLAVTGSACCVARSDSLGRRSSSWQHSFMWHAQAAPQPDVQAVPREIVEKETDHGEQTYDVYVHDAQPLAAGEEKHMLSVFVADEKGLINRVAGVFARRGAIMVLRPCCCNADDTTSLRCVRSRQQFLYT
jgi:hypothetical protein